MPGLLETLQQALADRYRVEREIGRGGMATVFLAEDLKHHRKVAVKVLDESLAEAIGRRRFLLEIEVAASSANHGTNRVGVRVACICHRRGVDRLRRIRSGRIWRFRRIRGGHGIVVAAAIGRQKHHEYPMFHLKPPNYPARTW